MIQMKVETPNGIRTQALADLEGRPSSSIEGEKNIVKLESVVGKILKDLVNKTIDREYWTIGENYIDNLKEVPQLHKQDRELTQRMIDVLGQLNKVLPKEYHHLISEIDEITASKIGVESSLYFRKGVLLGLTELKYLGEVVNEIAYL